MTSARSARRSPRIGKSLHGELSGIARSAFAPLAAGWAILPRALPSGLPVHSLARTSLTVFAQDAAPHEVDRHQDHSQPTACAIVWSQASPTQAQRMAHACPTPTAAVFVYNAVVGVSATQCVSSPGGRQPRGAGVPLLIRTRPRCLFHGPPQSPSGSLPNSLPLRQPMSAVCRKCDELQPPHPDAHRRRAAPDLQLGRAGPEPVLPSGPPCSWCYACGPSGRCGNPGRRQRSPDQLGGSKGRKPAPRTSSAELTITKASGSTWRTISST